MIYDSILGAIGNTPMIRLQRMTDKDDAELLVKFEGLNVGGSIKIRTAYNMILDAESRGLLHKNSIIVEPTSGNQGVIQWSMSMNEKPLSTRTPTPS